MGVALVLWAGLGGVPRARIPALCRGPFTASRSRSAPGHRPVQPRGAQPGAPLGPGVKDGSTLGSRCPPHRSEPGGLHRRPGTGRSPCPKPTFFVLFTLSYLFNPCVPVPHPGCSTPGGAGGISGVLVSSVEKGRWRTSSARPALGLIAVLADSAGPWHLCLDTAVTP